MTVRNADIRNYPWLPALSMALLVFGNGCNATESTRVEGAMSERPESAETRSGQVDIAKRDLAKRLSISIDRINVVDVREVTWRDGSVGCPRPGMLYKQVLVNGSLIILEANGVRYEYHSGDGRGPFYCADPEPPVPPDANGFGKT
ncbi:MAG: hypothetical protein OEQ30_10870 [Gammaproteobacteria bacterium]|nr:hypothetical protein [Gammaproteobacteria bacterium]